jgi:hypothetical protein
MCKCKLFTFICLVNPCKNNLKEKFVLSRFSVVNSPFFDYIKIHKFEGNFSLISLKLPSLTNKKRDEDMEKGYI